MQKVLDWFSAALRAFEDILAHVSSPVLAAGLAIGMVDILTDGKLLVSAPWILYGWAGTQTVGVDIMLPMMADRTLMAGMRKNITGTIFYLLMTAALGYVAFIGAMAFSLQQSQGISVQQAMAELGITPLQWLIERNLLAVMLVVLSGILRKKPVVKTVEQLKQEMAEGDARAEYAAWKRRQVARSARGLLHMARAVASGQEMVEEAPDDAQPEDAADAQAPALLSALRKGPNAQARMKRVYIDGMTAAQLAKLAGVHRNTAAKYVAQREQAAREAGSAKRA